MRKIREEYFSGQALGEKKMRVKNPKKCRVKHANLFGGAARGLG